MGEIVNLRRTRKDRARGDREKQAAENRVRFGRTAAEREAQAAAETKAARVLDGHRRDVAASGDDL